MPGSESASPWLAASAAIVDGHDVDWAQLRMHAVTPHERELLDQLHVLADIAELHRLSDGSEPAGSVERAGLGAARGAVVPEGIPSRRAGQRWGHYELLEQVGTGAFGDVFRARDLMLDREVAVKLFRDREGTERSVDRMLLEARAMAKVPHPNVVTIHGAESHDGRAGLCMEYVAGSTLEALVRARGPMSAGDVATIGQELCRAVAAVHSAGLVHRDITARNVMIDQGGRVVLMDFGAGQIRRNPEQLADRLTGTPRYLAPEVLAGREASVQSDVYSLGVLLCFLATGRYPIRRSAAPAVADTPQASLCHSVRELRPDLPEAFCRAVERAIDPDPLARTASAGQLQVALAHAFNLDVSQRLRYRRGRYWGIGLAAATFIGTVIYEREPITSELALSSEPPIRSVAVLPFANRSAGGTYEYLGSGFAEILNAALAPSLEVRRPARTASSGVDSTDPAAIGRTHGVDAVVMGEYGVQGDALTVTYRVVDPSRDAALSSAGLRLTLSDLVDARRQLSSAVIGTLQGETAATLERVTTRPTTRPAALDDWLRATYALAQYSHEPSLDRYKEAERLVLRALEEDANFTTALVTFARLRWMNVLDRVVDGESEDGLAAAALATDRALAVDPTLADAHAMRALVDVRRGALDQARARLKVAAERLPATALVHYASGFYFMARGLAAESIGALQRARMLDADLVRRELGLAYQYSGDLARAAAEFGRDAALHPGDVAVQKALAFALTGLGRLAEAEAVLAAARPPSAGDRRADLVDVYLQVRRGVTSGVDAWLRAARAAEWNDPDACADVAAVLAAAGRAADAVSWLERAGELGMRSYPYVATSPLFADLRALPRFQAWVSMLEQEWRANAQAEAQAPLWSPAAAP